MFGGRGGGGGGDGAEGIANLVVAPRPGQTKRPAMADTLSERAPSERT